MKVLIPTLYHNQLSIQRFENPTALDIHCNCTTDHTVNLLFVDDNFSGLQFTTVLPCTSNFKDKQDRFAYIDKQIEDARAVLS